MKNKQIIISLGILAVILIAGVFSNGKPPLAHAGASQNVSGWAWSNMDDPTTSADESTIGWVSFNSSSDGSGFDYGVNIDPTTGAFSGYGWSENIGWIYFGPDFQNLAANFAPEEPKQFAKLDLATNKVSGWAYALAGAGSPGGWDGWIKMSGTAKDNSTYGVSRNGCKLQGYAWGSDVIGWLQFDPINVDCQNLPPEPPVITTLPLTQQAPTAVDQSVTVNRDSSNNIIILTATDPENDTLTYSIVSQPLKGTLTGTAPNLTYSPNAGYSGPDNFTFKVNDGHSDSNTATVTITVNSSVNQAPTANAGGNRTVNENTIITISGSGSDLEDSPDKLTYKWTGGGAVYLSDTTIPSPTFAAPGVSGNTPYTIILTVTDTGGLTASNQATIMVQDTIPLSTFLFNALWDNGTKSKSVQLLETSSVSVIANATISSINSFSGSVNLSVVSITNTQNDITRKIGVSWSPNPPVFLGANETKKVVLTLSIPSDVKEGEYNIALQAESGQTVLDSLTLQIGIISPTFRER